MLILGLKGLMGTSILLLHFLLILIGLSGPKSNFACLWFTIHKGNRYLLLSMLRLLFAFNVASLFKKLVNVD